MKNILYIFGLLVVFSACKQGSSLPQDKAAGKISAGKNSIKYFCPMDTDIVKNKPGVCPKCGMKLVKK
ncbi:MAG: hypothetical protein EOP42_05675 [Sphingobacteriaceae bacterium]|nr:MAG: hypothetical protein EOP42_05675 [Sphingobacteriaceae bacterium]